LRKTVFHKIHFSFPDFSPQPGNGILFHFQAAPTVVPRFPAYDSLIAIPSSRFLPYAVPYTVSCHLCGIDGHAALVKSVETYGNLKD